MNRFVLFAAAALSALALASGQASAQYAQEFTQAKLIHQGTTTAPIAGSGKVVVQVQVNADGSHKVTKIIHSSNSGDNAAAMEIAQTSTYRPAHRGTTPVPSFYDFTFQFKGKSVVSQSTSEGMGSTGALSPAAAQVAALIREHQYAQAKSKAQVLLISSPGDQSLRQIAGVAAADAGDFTAAAEAFDKVPNIAPQFRTAAAASFATAAVKLAMSQPEQSLAYAEKAVALNPDTNSHFALGVAQLSNNDDAAALASLKNAHDAAMADPKIPVASKVNIDAELLQAYVANNDTQDAQTIAAQIKQLDPNSTAGTQAMAARIYKSGQAALAAKDFDTAVKDFDQAASSGDPTLAVTANLAAAFAIAQSAKPDWKRMQSYADKAVALQPNNAQANFAEGVALTGQWAANKDDATKRKAADALGRADAEAKAAGNEALALQIETFAKQNLNEALGAPSGGGE